ncbi:hypothetical protein [Pararhodobacter aggregans]|uniref:hypothetical protein n=1 Tax=Pararhodobacter aggregans TaxID=404875 RepID=UPI00105802D5|nr:hypothetical protein [Pararhodobacter aggregans]
MLVAVQASVAAAKDKRGEQNAFSGSAQEENNQDHDDTKWYHPERVPICHLRRHAAKAAASRTKSHPVPTVSTPEDTQIFNHMKFLSFLNRTDAAL